MNITNNTKFSLLSFFIMIIAVNSSLCAMDAGKILDDVDALRVYSTEGFSFDMSVKDNNGDLNVMRIYVNEYDESICAYKNDATGRYILLKDKSFWFYDKGMNAPIRISERQLLVGQASSGDITRIVFSQLYEITGSAEEEDLYTLDLKAKKKSGATYDKIRLYINKKDIKPVKAECCSNMGIILKTIYYKEFKMIDGKEMLTGFEIMNELTKEKSYVELDNFKNEKLPDNYFNKNYMRFLRLN